MNKCGETMNNVSMMTMIITFNSTSFAMKKKIKALHRLIPP